MAFTMVSPIPSNTEPMDEAMLLTSPSSQLNMGDTPFHNFFYLQIGYMVIPGPRVCS